jgi:hypothetical protein
MRLSGIAKVTYLPEGCINIIFNAKGPQYSMSKVNLVPRGRAKMWPITWTDVGRIWSVVLKKCHWPLTGRSLWALLFCPILLNISSSFTQPITYFFQYCFHYLCTDSSEKATLNYITYHKATRISRFTLFVKSSSGIPALANESKNKWFH